MKNPLLPIYCADCGNFTNAFLCDDCIARLSPEELAEWKKLEPIPVVESEDEKELPEANDSGDSDPDGPDSSDMLGSPDPIDGDDRAVLVDRVPEREGAALPDQPQDETTSSDSTAPTEPDNSTDRPDGGDTAGPSLAD